MAGGDATQLRPAIEQLREGMAAAGKPPPGIVFATQLPLDDPPRAADQVAQLAAVGVTRLVHGWRYADAAAFARGAEVMHRFLSV